MPAQHFESGDFTFRNRFGRAASQEVGCGEEREAQPNESIIDHTKQSWYFSNASSALTSKRQAQSFQRSGLVVPNPGGNEKRNRMNPSSITLNKAGISAMPLQLQRRNAKPNRSRGVDWLSQILVGTRSATE
ncbi:Hypothetical_protein [Hexamita inflata]|uniref:Hypothetical_protein n=1 Tax=Hexamita inflata TaxID=28002 RepID=A0ABP1H620_9EUKA